MRGTMGLSRILQAARAFGKRFVAVRSRREARRWRRAHCWSFWRQCAGRGATSWLDARRADIDYRKQRDRIDRLPDASGARHQHDGTERG